MPGPSRSLFYRERADALRRQAAGLPDFLQPEFLDLAERYDRLADGIDTWGQEHLAAEALMLAAQLPPNRGESGESA
jgi:hypothetical protein